VIPRRSLNRTRALVVITAFAIVLGACGQRAEAPLPEDVVFVVNLEQLGPIYENEVLGLKYRPPLHWDQLEGAQRQAVLDSLAPSDEAGNYSLEVVDVFFDTNSMSFSSIGRVVGAESGPGAQEYAEGFGETLGLSNAGPADEDDAIVARMEFSVNDIPVVQFRHLQSNRITFTLLFPSFDGTLIQLDYSIPTENYRGEAKKLESSIGTLQLIH
jgi:hypothetical protein